MDLYMKCGKNKSSWNVRLMRHENHIKIEMMEKQKRTENRNNSTTLWWIMYQSVCTCPKCAYCIVNNTKANEKFEIMKGKMNDSSIDNIE